MFNFRVRWSPVSFCSKMQLMLTSRTLRAEDPSTTPPCWDTLGLSSTSSSSLLHQTLTQRTLIGRFEECVATLIMFYAPKITKNFSLCFRQVCLFLKRGANQNAADIDEKTPLTIAVEAANADIVTLWGLCSLSLLFVSLLFFFVYRYLLCWLNFHTVKHNQPAQLSSACNYLGFGA